MPGYDGSGPRGEGSMTGGARGYCVLPTPARPVYRAPVYRAPVGPRFGRGFSPRGRGRHGHRGGR